MNVLWFHFHCWHTVGDVTRDVTHNHGLTRDRMKLDVQRCCQCPARREGHVGWEGEYVKPEYWVKRKR